MDLLLIISSWVIYKFPLSLIQGQTLGRLMMNNTYYRTNHITYNVLTVKKTVDYRNLNIVWHMAWVDECNIIFLTEFVLRIKHIKTLWLAYSNHISIHLLFYESSSLNFHINSSIFFFLVSLFNWISTFVSNFMPKLYS